MKKSLALISSIVMVSAMQVTYAADTTQPNIAVVNVQQLLQKSPKIKALNEKLQGQFKSRQEKLIGEQKDLQAEVEKFKKESPTMSAKTRDSMQKRINDDQSNLVKQVTAFQKDLNAEQNKAMQGVLGELNSIISKLAKKNSYSLVLDSQAVIYANETADITKDVSKEFDESK